MSAKGGQFDARSAKCIFGDVHAAAENDYSPFRAHRARNSARLFRQTEEPVISGSFSFVGLQPSMKRIRMAADWARVAVPWGSSVDPVTPVIMPSPQAHCIALIAYSLIDAKSL